MQATITQKLREQFASMAIYKDPASTNSLFAGRNLPSFVKDFILKRFIGEEGAVDRIGLTNFLEKVIPQKQTEVKDRLSSGEELTLLTRFIIYIDLVKGVRRFGIPDLGIKINEGQIPEYVYRKHQGELVDGEKWGIIKLSVLPDEDGKKNHVEMVDYNPSSLIEVLMLTICETPVPRSPQENGLMCCCLQWNMKQMALRR